MYLVIVDTAQIQPYIFGSNRLRENIGGSYLVAQATGDWPKEIVRQAAPNHNITINGMLDGTKRIEDPTDNLDAEVLYAGGGNFVVLFRDESHTRAFIRALSRKVLTDAPNLQLVVMQDVFEWREPLSETVNTIFRKLAEEKRSRILSAPLLGLAVTVMCQSTALPAVDVIEGIGDDPDRPASAEIVAKLKVLDEAEQRLRRVLPLPDGYDYPRQLDHLGGTRGKHNFIAVVHADGNGLGQRIMDIGKAHSAANKNREYINALRTFSEQVDASAQQALRDVLDRLGARIRKDGSNRIVHKNGFGEIIAEIRLKCADEGKRFLPFRPIVFGGDDVAFVCDGRLGLSLAIEYIRQIESHTGNLPDGRGQLTACAGIAIVKAHYPFARAYKLTDELCKQAKKYRKTIKDFHHDWDDSCLDWHFALSGLSGGINNIREREYRVKSGWLTLRPIALKVNPREPAHAWGVVRRGIESFQDLPPSSQSDKKLKWSTRRNKVKALRDALRDGPDSVKHFLMKFNENKPLPDVEPSLSDWKDTGWQGGYCGYFDALELADWFVPL